ncbi:phage tail tape measure protein [Xanthobacter flavus]|uniref:phage tail tape measure protein n=1 Tax=Xanthobacter flavus TaxID=281 RepID=UPI001AE71EA2|nr:phage tail tape measure protein [Xanthobacter flavus]MBP2147928.1 TP901 family phage tail tape measure protein [Xanthobacter flavus]
MRTMEARAVISAQDKTGGVFRQVAAKIRGLERASAMQSRAAPLLERGARAASGWGAGLAVAAGGLAAMGGAAVGGKIKDAVVDYAALERQMNRIGLTGGASAAETTRATEAIKVMAESMKMPLDQAVSGLDALVASGKSMGEALDFLPSVLATAQASGAATADMAKTAMTVSKAMKVPASEMQAAFDSLVVAGNLGNFELDAMAQHLPKIAASAQKLGLVGVDGVQRLGAMLQVVRESSGTEEQAATGMTDAFEKLLSPTVLKAAQKQGHDFEKIMLKAEKQGKNSFEAIIEYLKDKTKGTDLEKNLLLSSIFSEADSRRAIVGLMKDWDLYQSKLAEVKKSQGAVSQQLVRILNDAQAQLTVAQTKFNNAALAVGQQAMPAVTQFLERADLEVQLFKEQMQDLDGWMKRNLGFGLADVQKATNFGGPSNDDIRADIKRRQEERDNPARARLNALEDEKRRHQASLAGDQQHVDTLRGYGYTPAQIAAEVPTYAATQNKLEELDRLIAAARLNVLIASGGRFPADQGDRMKVRANMGRRPADMGDWEAARDAYQPPFPVPVDRSVPFPTPVDRGAITAVVQDPVPVTGTAEVKVTVTVDPSNYLIATLKEARGAMKIQNGPSVGRSMPEAEPSSGTSSGP